MLPVRSTLVKVRRAASALYQSSSTGNATNHDGDLDGEVDDPGETTTQKTPKIHSRTDNQPLHLRRLSLRRKLFVRWAINAASM